MKTFFSLLTTLALILSPRIATSVCKPTSLLPDILPVYADSIIEPGQVLIVPVLVPSRISFGERMRNGGVRLSPEDLPRGLLFSMDVSANPDGYLVTLSIANFTGEPVLLEAGNLLFFIGECLPVRSINNA